MISIPNYWVGEHKIAYYVTRLVKTLCSKLEPVLDERFNAEQTNAVLQACHNRCMILTGPAGSGKTTVAQCIIDSWVKAGLKNLRVIGPSGAAAQRADVVINSGREKRIPCSTTNSLLTFDPKNGSYKFNRNNHLKADAILVDEWAMQGVLTACDFLEAIDHKNTRILFMGDIHQLPSVDAGAVMRDMIASGVVPVAYLTEVMRAAMDSGITVNANRILRGQPTSNVKLDDMGIPTQEKFNDFFFIRSESLEDTQQKIIDWAVDVIPDKRKIPNENIQVITPGKEAIVGRKELNSKLRDRLVPLRKETKTLDAWRVGDRVRHMKNIKAENLINGSRGVIRDLVAANGGGHLVIDFGSNAGPKGDGEVSIALGAAKERLQMNFASTVHGSQGNEHEVVLTPVHSCHTRLFTRNLLYTDDTRAKKMMCFIGEPKVMDAGIRNDREMKRQTRLSQFLQDEFQRYQSLSSGN